MKKLIITGVKTIIFFIGWAVLAGLVPLPDFSNKAVWRFCAELLPFLFIVIFTLIFWLFDKKKIKIHIISKPLKNICIGFGAGLFWLGVTVTIFISLGLMKITSYNAVTMLYLWILSVFINAIMQELLVRGYLYQMIKNNYNVIASIIVTTILFTVLHGGAFEAGIIPVLNVATMSILMTVVLEYTQSLIAPIIMHFIWNSIGAVILGAVSLANDYPHLLTTAFTGNKILSGGEVKIEGSIIVLSINILLIILFLFLIKNKTSHIQMSN